MPDATALAIAGGRVTAAEAMAASRINAAGLPALAFRGGFEDGLPIGAQLVGRTDADRALLALAEPLAGHVHSPYPAPIAGLPE